MNTTAAPEIIPGTSPVSAQFASTSLATANDPRLDHCLEAVTSLAFRSPHLADNPSCPIRLFGLMKNTDNWVNLAGTRDPHGACQVGEANQVKFTGSPLSSASGITELHGGAV